MLNQLAIYLSMVNQIRIVSTVLIGLILVGKYKCNSSNVIHRTNKVTNIAYTSLDRLNYRGKSDISIVSIHLINSIHSD